ncbi:MAG: hypothetical protein Tsb0020_52380 [Haliangiales bacterium]
MRGKILLCRCEDVTLKDVHASIAHGYDDIEEIKRYTGFGTGPCQGKECLALVATALAEATGQDPAEIPPFTSRPPLAPTPFKHYAALTELDPGDDDTDADADAAAEPKASAAEPEPSAASGDDDSGRGQP